MTTCDRSPLIHSLLSSSEPAVRWRTMVRVLGEDPTSPAVKRIENDVRTCPRVVALLADRDADGRLPHGNHVYAKWQGAHWVLAALADLGYPSGDASLEPIANQLLECWLHDGYFQEFEADSKARAYQKRGVPLMQGRYRRCASQQGLTLYLLLKLGVGRHKLDKLAERLIHWQWPDGGWNCDKNPQADTSSLMETLLPMRGLWLYGLDQKSVELQHAARRAAEVLLTRRLFKRRSNGEVIHPTFVQLHYPLYWHYDFLAGLKGMAELGLIDDPRCSDALDLLEQKELPSGGWPAEARHYHVTDRIELHADCVAWGPTGKRKMNEWVTTDALYVLRAAGRLSR